MPESNKAPQKSLINELQSKTSTRVAYYPYTNSTKNILLAKVVSDAGVASVDYRENPYRTALDSIATNSPT